MRKLFFLFPIFLICSCSSVYIEDKTACNLNIDDIVHIIKSNNQNIKEVVIQKSFDERLTNSECNGLFYLKVKKWNGVKTSRNLVSVPLIKTSQRLFINLSTINGKENIGDVKINDDLMLFEKEASNYFDEEEIKMIKKSYRYGIEIIPKGYLVK